MSGLAVLVIALTLVAAPEPAHSQVSSPEGPHEDHCGELTTDATWSSNVVHVITCTVSIPASKKLTLGPGAVVKVPSGQAGLQVNRGGSFLVQGTKAQPAVLTSLSDDLAGGDTNADGATPPDSAAWLVTVNSGARVAITYARFRHAESAIIDPACAYGDGSARLTVSDSSFNSPVRLMCGAVGAPVFRRNQFGTFAGRTPPVSVSMYLSQGDPSGISLDGPNRNIFTGPAADRGLYLGTYLQTTLPAGKTWTVGGDARGALVMDGGLAVGGTLILRSGAIVKVRSGARPIEVNEGGSLRIAGTRTRPVVLTSLSDDSAGGDTNRDDPTTSQMAPQLIRANAGARIAVAFARFRYADSAIIDSSCAVGIGSAQLTVADSLFNSPVRLMCGTVGAPVFRRNRFGGFAESASAVSAALFLGQGDPSGIILNGPNRNTFTGPAADRGVYVGAYLPTRLPAGKTWTVGGDSRGVLVTDGNGLAVDGTLVLQAGAIVKTRPNAGTITVGDGGSLRIQGTAARPVVLTSLIDDSTGGDTNGDGNQTTPNPGDYGTAIQVPADGHLNVASAEFRYGSTAIETRADTVNLSAVGIQHVSRGLVVPQGSVAFRGRIRDVPQAVTACTWQSRVCLVDAAFVDWGTPTGPWTAADDPMVCGAVTVNPWVGSAGGSSMFSIRNCDSGWPTPEEQLMSAADGFNQRYLEDRIDCSNGFQDACEAARRAYACLTGAVEVANSQSGLPAPVKIPKPPDDPKDTTDIGPTARFALRQFATSAGEYVAQAETLKVTALAHIPASGFGRVAGLVGKALGLVGTFLSLSQAYDACR